MTSTKPYIIRAMREWILDNNCTPHIVVNTLAPGIEMPSQFVDNEQIVFNLSPTAITNLVIDNVYIQFQARFSGMVHHIYIPIYAVLAIQAKENGQGTVFPIEDNMEPPPETTSSGGKGKSGKSKAKLSLVK